MHQEENVTKKGQKPKAAACRATAPLMNAGVSSFLSRDGLLDAAEVEGGREAPRPISAALLHNIHFTHSQAEQHRGA